MSAQKSCRTLLLKNGSLRCRYVIVPDEIGNPDGMVIIFSSSFFRASDSHRHPSVPNSDIFRCDRSRENVRIRHTSADNGCRIPASLPPVLPIRNDSDTSDIANTSPGTECKALLCGHKAEPCAPPVRISAVR